MEEKIVEYAPFVIVMLGFLWQNKIFVKPEELERKHREILDQIDKEFAGKYVELNAYKEFQSHMYSELEKISSGVNDLKDFLIGKGK
jgi:hypothetical protein